MKFANISGLTIHYQVDGVADGPALVFINSLGTDMRIWDEVVLPFVTRFRIIRYDKRGHGLSDCPVPPYSIRDFSTELIGLLDFLGVGRATIVGISVGGMIAIDFAGAWPERVEKLVLCDTAPVIGTAEMWNERINTLRQNGMSFLSEAIMGRWFAPSFMEVNKVTTRGYTNLVARIPVDGYTGTCEAIRDADLTAVAKSITVPTLILVGAEDPSTPPTLVRGLRDLIPQAHYHEIPEAGHLPCVEKPAETAGLIAEFLG